MVNKRQLTGDVILAWLISTTIVVIAAYAAGENPWNATSYARGDSGFYRGIGFNGYRLFPCPDNPANWCGDAGWMPGYPALIRLLGELGIERNIGALLVTNAALIGCLVLLRHMIERIAPGRDNRMCFLISAVFPGGIYFHAIFPMSLLMFCALGSLLLLAERRLAWASIVSALGAFSYATGFLLAGVVGSAALFTSGPSWPRRLINAILYGAIAFSGLLAVMLLHQILLGHWNAFFLVQAKYGHGIHNPFLTISMIWENFRFWPEDPDFAKMAPRAQSLIICILVSTLTALLLVRRSEITRIEWLAAVPSIAIIGCAKIIQRDRRVVDVDSGIAETQGTLIGCSNRRIFVPLSWNQNDNSATIENSML